MTRWKILQLTGDARLYVSVYRIYMVWYNYMKVQSEKRWRNGCAPTVTTVCVGFSECTCWGITVLIIAHVCENVPHFRLCTGEYRIHVIQSNRYIERELREHAMLETVMCSLFFQGPYLLFSSLHPLHLHLHTVRMIEMPHFHHHT